MARVLNVDTSACALASVELSSVAVSVFIPVPMLFSLFSVFRTILSWCDVLAGVARLTAKGGGPDEM